VNNNNNSTLKLSRSLSVFRAAAVALTMFSTGVAAAGTISEVCDIGVVSCQSNSVGGFAAVGDRYSSDEAIATYGLLAVSSSTSFGIPGEQPTSLPYSFAIGFVSDNITISAPGFNGSEGFLQVDYTLDGTNAASRAGSAVVQIDVGILDSGSSVFQDSNTAYTSSLIAGTFTAPRTFTFTFGQPFTFDFCLGAAAGDGIIPAVLSSSGRVSTFECAPGYSFYQTGSGSGSATFFDTLMLSGLTVTDSFGNPVSGAQFTSSSGTQYGPRDVALEPGTLLMLGSGLAVIALLRRKDHLTCSSCAGRWDEKAGL